MGDITLLIVDDVDINREILNALFEGKYTILEAGNGAEALSIIEGCHGNIDLVLLDLIMPEMDGLEVLRRRREMECFLNVPVVVITGSECKDDQIQAFELGASDFVNKPFEPEIVLSRIENVLNAHRRIRVMEKEAHQLKVKAELDQMTELLNKTTSEMAITDILKNKGDKCHAMFVIDIDNFKSVNDTLGHLAGDKVICTIANLIAGFFRKSDIVGRIGGDEFVVLMVDVPSMDIVRTKAAELVQLMKYKPNLDIPDMVTLSVGLADNGQQSCDYSDLFHKADEALYMAKEEGKARYFEYGVSTVVMEKDLRPAIALLSTNRSICSIIQNIVPEEIHMVEVNSIKRLAELYVDENVPINLVYADVSGMSEEINQAFWAEMAGNADIASIPVLAICQDGDMEQYRRALDFGVCDILSSPIDAAAIKRRMARIPSPNQRTDNKK